MGKYQSSENPYQPPSILPNKTSYDDGNLAKRISDSFVYREIDILWPTAMRLKYSGWDFMQRVWIDRRLLWWRISWAKFHRHISFQLPPEVSPSEQRCEIQIDFGFALRIRHFMVAIDQKIVYEEIHV